MPLRTTECRKCRREVAAHELDDQRWCRACRAPVLARANRWGRIGALTATLLLLAWIVVAIAPSTRFLVAWMAIVAATYLIVNRIVRRVAFEVIRARMSSPNNDA